jgi:CubicO group peptidase (beta-lactamase class C family)
MLTTRDYARMAYMLLRDGRWDGREVVAAEWVKRLTTTDKYRNTLSNCAGDLGTQYPRDMFRTKGSGFNLAYVIPSLDLVAVRTSRFFENIDENEAIFLAKLFAAIEKPE